MKCPNCSKENQPTNQFCVFCGARLYGETPPPASPEPEPPQSIEEEVRRLRDSVRQINTRLSALEQRQGVAQVPFSPALPPVEEWVPPSPIPRAVPEPRAPRPPREWEQILGGNWLARIGVLALLFGVGFFLKFAFDKNWIVPVVRVLIGVVAGFVMLGGGYLWRKRYPVLMQVLTGGGIGVLYLSIFASFTAYDLVPFLLAVILLVAVCAASVFLALRYDSMGLAILGIIGAFIAPFVLGVVDTGVTSTVNTGAGYEILIYILIIDLGVLVVSTFRNWRWFTLLALLFSLVVYGVWYGTFESETSLAGAEILLTILFLIFAGATTLFHIIWRRPSQPFDYATMTINAASYAGISLGLLWGNMRDWTGGFVLALALFYGGMAYFTRGREAGDHRLSLFALGIAIILLTMAIPVQFGDRSWTAVAWAAEGAVLVWLALRTGIDMFRWAGYGAFFITAFRLLIFDTAITVRDFVPVVNERFLAYAVGIAAMYVTGFFLSRWKNRLTADEGRVAVPAFFIAANFFTIWLLTAEVLNTFDRQLYNLPGFERFGDRGDSLQSFQNLSITGLWAVYAIVALVVGIFRRIRFLRLGALVLLLITIGKVFFYDIWTLAMVFRIVGLIGFGLLLLAAGFLYQRYRRTIVTFLKE